MPWWSLGRHFRKSERIEGRLNPQQSPSAKYNVWNGRAHKDHTEGVLRQDASLRLCPWWLTMELMTAPQ